MVVGGVLSASVLIQQIMVGTCDGRSPVILQPEPGRGKERGKGRGGERKGEERKGGGGEEGRGKERKGE